jgi:exopolyphosphatase/guanosine-5'-triphosphate,3'-diphosphate pyrophosphatase
MKLAVVDIGTNSIHMLMAEILPNFSYEVIGREKEMIRLGDGTLTQGYLSDELMEVGLQTLKKFKYLANSKGITKINAVATSAVREAQNGGGFLKRIKKETGINVRIITGEEEGRLIYLGVKHSIPLKAGNSLIIDIGGGSVEMMVVTRQEILFLTSLKLGSARLYSRFLEKKPGQGFSKMENHIREEIREAVEAILELGFSEVIGTSGTLNNLAAMAFYQQHPSGVSLSRSPVLTLKDLETLYAQLRRASPEQRLEMKGLDPRRSDIILSGAAVASTIAGALNVEKIHVADKALREGMIYHYIHRNRRTIRSEAEIPDIRRRSVLRLAHKCDYAREHAHQTAKLSLQIFDKTENFHRLSSLDRELLEYAALLHDIGYYIGFEKHHKHAYYLIKNISMNGFSEEEVEIMALVACYHRRAAPKKNNMGYRTLSKGVRRRVRWMSGILRIADALDRSHFSVVESVRIRTYDHKLVFHVESSHDVEYEVWEAYHKSKFFENLVGRKVEFKPKVLPKKRAIHSRAKVSRIGKIRAVL